MNERTQYNEVEKTRILSELTCLNQWEVKLVSAVIARNIDSAATIINAINMIANGYIKNKVKEVKPVDKVAVQLEEWKHGGAVD